MPLFIGGSTNFRQQKFAFIRWHTKLVVSSAIVKMTACMAEMLYAIKKILDAMFVSNNSKAKA